MKALEEKNGKILLHVRVQPRASRNALALEPDGRARVSLTAPPVDDAANKALVEFIAKLMGLRKASVSLESGDKSREKTLALMGLSLPEAAQKLANFKPGGEG
jgi:uncharacterized protein (TIGR00251 family)